MHDLQQRSYINIISKKASGSNRKIVGNKNMVSPAGHAQCAFRFCILSMITLMIKASITLTTARAVVSKWFLTV